MRGKPYSFSSFGNGYIIFQDHIAVTDKAKTVLAGTHKFVNVEIEVYHGENEETDLWETSTISNRTSYDSMNETCYECKKLAWLSFNNNYNPYWLI